MFCKNSVLKDFANFTGKYLCQSLFFSKDVSLSPATLLIKRLYLEQVFFCESYDVFKNLFFYRTPLVEKYECQQLYYFLSKQPPKFLMWKGRGGGAGGIGGGSKNVSLSVF